MKMRYSKAFETAIFIWFIALLFFGLIMLPFIFEKSIIYLFQLSLITFIGIIPVSIIIKKYYFNILNNTKYLLFFIASELFIFNTLGLIGLYNSRNSNLNWLLIIFSFTIMLSSFLSIKYNSNEINKNVINYNEAVDLTCLIWIKTFFLLFFSAIIITFIIHDIVAIIFFIIGSFTSWSIIIPKAFILKKIHQLKVNEYLKSTLLSLSGTFLFFIPTIIFSLIFKIRIERYTEGIPYFLLIIIPITISVFYVMQNNWQTNKIDENEV